MAAKRILLIEQNTSLTEQLRSAICSDGTFELVSSYKKAQEALSDGHLYSPDVVLFDIDYAPNLDLLAKMQHNFKKALIICSGIKWQASAMERANALGIKAYINKPFEISELSSTIAIFKQGDNHHCMTIAFFSPKGKSGKTTLLANIALALGLKTKKKIGVIDADLQFGDLSVFLNLNPQNTIFEAVRDIDFLSPASLEEYFYSVNENVAVLCGTKQPEYAENVTAKAFNALLRMAKQCFDYLLIDLQPAFNPISIAAAEASDLTYLVTMLGSGFEKEHVQKALYIFEDWQDCKRRLKLIYTRVEPCTPQALENISSDVGYPVEAIFPNDYLMVSTAANNGQMIVDLSRDSQFATETMRLADKIIAQGDLA